MILSNGVTILESPFPYGNDIEICIVNYGAIRDHQHGIVGIQHLIEHKAFTSKDLNLSLNASTTINHMYFHISDIVDEKDLLKVLQMWFCKTSNGIKLAHNCNLIDIQRCVYEIDNEYTYRNTSYDLHDLLYFILMREVSMFFCGNVRTFTEIDKIKSVIDNLELIQPQDIVVLYKSGVSYLVPALEDFFSQFKSYSSPLSKIDFSMREYYKKYIETDTSVYQIMFKIDDKLVQDLIYMPLLVHNSSVNINSYLKGSYARFFFESKQLFQDFLFLIESKKYHDIVPLRIYVDDDTFYDFIQAKKLEDLFLSNTDLLSIAVPKTNNILNKIRSLYLKGEFTVLGPRGEFTAIDQTISGEPVRIENFIVDFANYIYDYSYKNYMLGNSITTNTKWCKEKKTSFCFYPNLELKVYQNIPQKDTSLEETIKYLIQNILKSAPLNYELNSKLQQEKLIANEVYDIHFTGNIVTIKTKYDFTLFLLKLDKNAIEEFYLVLYTYLYQQKDLGNIYYFKIHFIKFKEYTIMSLFSNPSDFNKWKNSMISFFVSFNFTSYYIIQSLKSNIYDLSNLEKTTVVTF